MKKLTKREKIQMILEVAEVKDNSVDNFLSNGVEKFSLKFAFVCPSVAGTIG